MGPYVLSVLAVVAVTFAPYVMGGQCQLIPMKEKICNRPVAIKGKVVGVKEQDGPEGEPWNFAYIYTIDVNDIYRLLGTSTLNIGDTLKLFAPNQLISTAVRLTNQTDYFIQGTLKDDNTEINSYFCDTVLFSTLSEQDLRVLNGDEPYTCS